MHQFTDAARRLNHQVEVHALSPLTHSASPTSGAASERLVQAIKSLTRRYLHEPKELLWNTHYLPREWRLLVRCQPEVVLVRDYFTAGTYVMVARLLGVPLVIEVNAPAAERRLYADEYARLAIVDHLQKWKLHNCQAITVVSTALKHQLAVIHRISEERFTVVPNGADVTRFRAQIAPDAEYQAELADATVMGFVGSFQRFHGVELLAHMTTEIALVRSNVRFLFVGDGPGLPELKRLTAPLGSRVVFTGNVPHERIPGLVALLDVGIMPESNSYGSPMKLLEWMASGKAVVAPGYGPVQELIDHGVHGLVFPPQDADALVHAVLQLVDQPTLRSKLGKAAARRVQGELTWDHNATRVLATCQQALVRSTTGRAA